MTGPWGMSDWVLCTVRSSLFAMDHEGMDTASMNMKQTYKCYTHTQRDGTRQSTDSCCAWQTTFNRTHGSTAAPFSHNTSSAPPWRSINPLSALQLLLLLPLPPAVRPTSPGGVAALPALLLSPSPPGPTETCLGSPPFCCQPVANASAPRCLGHLFCCCGLGAELS